MIGEKEQNLNAKHPFRHIIFIVNRPEEFQAKCTFLKISITHITNPVKISILRSMSRKVKKNHGRNVQSFFQRSKNRVLLLRTESFKNQSHNKECSFGNLY